MRTEHLQAWPSLPCADTPQEHPYLRAAPFALSFFIIHNEKLMTD